MVLDSDPGSCHEERSPAKFMDKVGQASSRDSVPYHHFLTANLVKQSQPCVD